MASAPTRIVLDRPLAIAGQNLCGNVQVGEEQPNDPRSFIQTRTYWVKTLDLLPSGIVLVTGHDGKSYWLREWSWLE
jgi:hypothetical protein